MVVLTIAGALQAHRRGAAEAPAIAPAERAAPEPGTATVLIPPRHPLHPAANKPGGKAMPAAIAERPGGPRPPTAPAVPLAPVDDSGGAQPPPRPILILPAPKPHFAETVVPEFGVAKPGESREGGPEVLSAPVAKAPEKTLAAANSPIQPWKRYAQPYDPSDRRPRVALVIAGTDDNMERTIENLPAPITLALDPYARRLPEWIELARAKGHEVLLTLSMPPQATGRREAGPMAILSSLDAKENLERLDWALGRTTGFVGVLDLAGIHPAEKAGPILAAIERQGLMLVEGAAAEADATLPLARGDVVLTPDGSRDGVEKKLAALEDKARHDGRALGVALATPAIVKRIAAWAATLPRKSIALAPATSFASARPRGDIARE